MGTTHSDRTSTRWTYSEFARLPESGSTRYEVIADELIVTPSPTSRHQMIVSRLILRLGTFVEEHGLGYVLPAPLDVLFAEGDYVEPDVVFVHVDRAHLLSDRGIEGPPDLVVEVASPATAVRDRGSKLDRYRHFGVPEYWIVDPDEGTVEVWRLADGVDAPETLAAGDVLRWCPGEGGPELEVVVDDLLGG